MIRMAALSDAQQFAEIYNPYIETTMVTFEEKPLSREQFEKRMEGIMKKYPWIVYEEEGKVLGYAYLSAFNPRSAYDWTADLAIYVDMKEKGKGIGSKLMQTII
ncbi:MAG: N-acetyltransferase, partial [Solobacterium sp.]|nr:N-acetyltransferase [Solobacterium sp.]